MASQNLNLDEQKLAVLQAEFENFVLNDLKCSTALIYNVEKTTNVLVHQEVFNSQDREYVLLHSLREQRKDALIRRLATKEFCFVDRIIDAMECAGNLHLALCVKTFKIQLNRKHNLSIDDLMSPILPPSYPDRITPCPCDTRSSSMSSKPVTDNKQRVAPDDYLRNLVVCSANPKDIEQELQSVNSLDKLVWGSVEDETKKTTLHACFDRSDKKLEFMHLLLNFFDDLKRKPPGDQTEATHQWTIEEYINVQDSEGKTVAHRAAESGMEKALNELRLRGCDLFLKDNGGETALQLMYLYVPNAVCAILERAITLKPVTGNEVDVICDFSAVIGRPLTKNIIRSTPLVRIHVEADIGETKSLLSHRKCNARQPFEETWHLQDLISQLDPEVTKDWLTHPTIGLFLDFKWEKLKYWICWFAGIQICMYLFHTWFVVHVFLIECPYPLDNKDSSSTDQETAASFYENTITDLDSRPQRCRVGGFWVSLESVIILIYNFLFLIKEVVEIILKVQRSKSVLCGLKSYWNMFKNWLQITSTICLSFVAQTVCFASVLTDWDYALAAAGVVVSWILILMQWGILYENIGIYVQILITVTKTFFFLMRIYVLLIIGFSIAFCILFPQVEPFQNWLLAVAKIIIMMSGELDYNDLFYGDKGGPPILWMSHILFTFFAILMTFILLNLLVGLVVHDVKEVTDKSEVTLLSHKVDQLFVMESSIICLFDYICCNRGSNGGNNYPEIFVTPIGDAPLATKRMKVNELPKKLQERLRLQSNLCIKTPATEETKETMHCQ